MSRETSNLGLILYDPSEDKDVKVRDLINKVLGFTDSNTIKIDAKTKDIDTNIKTLHDSIIGTDGNVVFYNKQEVLLAVHPVGSIFLSTSDVEPASFIGGTWERIENCTIWGASDTHPARTKLEAGLPSVFGQVNDVLFGDGAQGDGMLKLTYNPSLLDEFPIGGDMKIYRSNIGLNNIGIYGNSDTVQPPAYCMYIWRRIE